MTTQPLAELAASLLPEEQAAVVEFVRLFRAQKDQPNSSPFLSAIDEFMIEHPGPLGQARRLTRALDSPQDWQYGSDIHPSHRS